MSNDYPQLAAQVVEAGFFDSVFAGVLVVVLGVLALLLDSELLDSDFVAGTLLEVLELLSPDARESVR